MSTQLTTQLNALIVISLVGALIIKQYLVDSKLAKEKIINRALNIGIILLLILFNILVGLKIVALQ
jgi:hypothetical protein